VSGVGLQDLTLFPRLSSKRLNPSDTLIRIKDDSGEANGMSDMDADKTVNRELLVSPFRKHKDDSLKKFKIGEFFPSNDPLAVDVVRLMAVDEDLANLERLKEMLEADRPTPETDEIGRTKWNRIQFLLARMRFGFLSNAWEDIFEKKEKRRPLLKELVAGMSEKVLGAYKEVNEAVAASPRAKNVIYDFRNQASFHYGYTQFQRGLKVVSDDTGEIIVNSTEKDLHFIIAYQVLDVVPAGRPSRAEIEQLSREIEVIQGKLHAFIIALVDEFVFRRAETTESAKFEPTRQDPEKNDSEKIIDGG
jgi:hypothetical protein